MSRMDAMNEGTRQPRSGSRNAARLLDLLASCCLLLALSTSRRAEALVWPDVAERVERDLSAADPATRRAAARELPSLGSRRGAPLAIAALSDPDDDVRLAAADAAIRLRASGATDAVTAWLNAPDVRLRRKACEVARALPSPRAVAPLARTLGDPDAEVRAAAAEALGHQMSPDAVPPLLGRLDDPTPAVRIQIMAALARLGDLRAVVPLVGKVEDSSPDVRQAVARALGDLGDRARVVGARAGAPRSERGRPARRARRARPHARAGRGRRHRALRGGSARPAPAGRASAALGRIATPDAVRVLVGALGTGDDGAGSLEPHPRARRARRRGHAAVVPSLRACPRRGTIAAAATSAAWVLGALHAHDEAAGHRRSPCVAARCPRRPRCTRSPAPGRAAQVPVVLEFVADPSPVVRDEALGAAIALLEPGHPDGRAVEPLAAALRDARPIARRARSHRDAPRPDGGAARRSAAGRADPRGRSGASPCRGRCAGRAGRQQCACSVGGGWSRADHDRSDDALLDALGSPDAAIRLHAAMALSDAGTGRARDALLAKLDGGDEVDRAAVLTALGRRAGASAGRRGRGEARGGPRVCRGAGARRGHRRPRTRAAAVRGARAIRGRALRGAVRSALGGDDVRGAPGRRDGDRGGRGALADEDPSVRAQAAWSLGAIGDGRTFAPRGGRQRRRDRRRGRRRGGDRAHRGARARAGRRVASRSARGSRTRGRSCARTRSPGSRSPAPGVEDGSAERAALADDPARTPRSSGPRASAAARAPRTRGPSSGAPGTTPRARWRRDVEPAPRRARRARRIRRSSTSFPTARTRRSPAPRTRCSSPTACCAPGRRTAAALSSSQSRPRARSVRACSNAAR